MKYIKLNLRLRPVRFAFLVNPSDSKQLLEVFRINTCLWGGKFNPIVPIRKNEKGDLSEKEKQIVKKYLDFFEPDFVVEAEKDISKDLNCKRVLSISSIFTHEPAEHGDEFQYGQSVKGLYKNLYETEFNSQYPFDPNDPSMQQKYSNIISVRTEDSQFKKFVACNFGDFPEGEGLEYFKRNYNNCLFPSLKTFRLNTPDLVYDLRYQSPLDISCKKLKIYSHNIHALFLLDVKDNEDLIDFWNLRGVYPNIKAVPIQCPAFSPFLKEFVKKHYPAPKKSELEKDLQWHRGSQIIHHVPIFSRSISKKEVERFYKLYIQYHYDKDIKSMWETRPCRKSSTEFLKGYRPTVEAKRRDIEVKLNERDIEINLDLLFPESGKSGGCFLWANVIKAQDLNNQIATAFPCNYRKNFINLKIVKERFDSYLESYSLDGNPKSYPLDERTEKTFLSTAEGLVIFSHNKHSSERWALMDGATAITNNLKNHKNIKTSQLSDAGRITQQIIRLLGFEGISSIANKSIVRLLEEMSNKRLKSLQLKGFQDKVNQAIGIKSKTNSLSKILIENKAVKLGMEIECNKCNKLSWYSLEKLNYSLICDFCLESYQFPVLKPDQIKWSYRVIGPFALSDYAQGGYAVALSIRFFTNIIGRYEARMNPMSPMNPYYPDSPEKSELDNKVTWSPGQELKFTSRDPIEVDFILWTQQWKQWRVEHSDVIFGEVKSFGEFEETDVERMQKLAEDFPGSLLVFATMKGFNDFSDIEKEGIKQLAEWGRMIKENGKPRALVMILTGTELFARSYLFTAWHERCKEFEKQKETKQVKKYREMTQLLLTDDSPYLRPRKLAYLTQYLYLDIPLKK